MWNEFRPGHESFPTYYDKNVLKVIENAVRFESPTPSPAPHTFGNRLKGWIDKRGETESVSTTAT